MHHPEVCTDGIYLKKRERQKLGTHFLQIAAPYKAEIINIAEYLNTNYKEEDFANIIQRHESNQQKANLTKQQKI
jgi:hypothetical protein